MKSRFSRLNRAHTGFRSFAPQKTENGETILYVNRYYEKNLTTGIVTTNYYLGGRLIATRENGTLTFVHQDHLTGTSLTTNSSGTSSESIKYYAFGLTRSGSISTEQKFTGQRLDGTGLYYYGARYYDPEIGRFISADLIIPDMSNPQAYNRYSYCLNNPLKYNDPSGLDYVFVGGAGSSWEDDWWVNMLIDLDWDPTQDRVLFIADPNVGGLPGLGFNTSDQAAVLTDALANGGYENIKIIGHSEGALATASVVDKLANDSNYLSGTNVRLELVGAVMIDAPTGFVNDQVVTGNSDSVYYNLPSEVAITMPQANILDVWNDASIVHHPGPMLGWNKVNTYHYDSRSFGQQLAVNLFGLNLWDRAIGTGLSYHSEPLHNPGVISRIRETFRIQ